MVARIRLHQNFSHVKLIAYDRVTIRLLGGGGGGVEGAELYVLGNSCGHVRAVS